MKILTTHTVKDVQRALNERNYKLAVDGLPGMKTDKALEDFQKKNGLYADCIVGERTAELLFSDDPIWKDAETTLPFLKLDCDAHGDGPGVTYLRQDAHESLQKVRDVLHSVDAKLTSSGGRRLLSASVGANRSQTSLHYLGIAHDLNVWSGMVDPMTDPYIVTKSVDNRWVVYARCSDLNLWPLTVPAYTHAFVKTFDLLEGYTYNHEKVLVQNVTCVNLTMLLSSMGWKGIRARQSFFTKKNKMGAEWWHFQYELALKPGVTFGSELLKSYKLVKLRTYSLWNNRNVRWQENWF